MSDFARMMELALAGDATKAREVMGMAAPEEKAKPAEHEHKPAERQGEHREGRRS